MEPMLGMVSVTDPRLDFSQKRDYVVLRGSRVNNWQIFNSTSISNNSVQIVCNPPDTRTAVSRFALKRFTFDITITGTNTGVAPLLMDGYYGPSCYPLVNATSSEQWNIGQSVISQAYMYSNWPALLRFHTNKALINGQNSLSASMPDHFPTLEQAVGSVKNPLSIYGSSDDQTRVDYVGFKVLTNTATSATIRFTITEPTFISPFAFNLEADYRVAFIGVSTMSYTCNFTSLTKLLSLAVAQGRPGVVNITNVDATIKKAALLMNFLSPSESIAIPRSMTYPYFQIVQYPTSSGTPVAPGVASPLLPSGNITLASIPRRIYIFARIDDSLNQGPFRADSYFGLPPNENPLTIKFGNDNYFSNASTEDLYNMSRKNGLELSYTEFTKHTGSILCIDFATDCGMLSNQSPGMTGNYNLQVNLTGMINLHPTETITPTLYIIAIYEGTFSIVDGVSQDRIGIITQQDVAMARPSPHVSYKNSNEVYGGNFFKKIGDFLGKAKKVLPKHLISDIVGSFSNPAAKLASSQLREQGWGYSGGKMRRTMRGGSLSSRSLKQKLQDTDDEGYLEHEDKKVSFDDEYDED